MSNSYITVAEPDSTEKKLDTDELTVGANQVHRERIVTSDPVDTAALGKVKAAHPASTDYGAVTRPIARHPSVASITRVAISGSSVQLLAAQAERARVTIVNESDAILFVKYGQTASGTSYTHRIGPGQEKQLPEPVYTGRIDGILTSAVGTLFAQVTEETW